MPIAIRVLMVGQLDGNGRVNMVGYGWGNKQGRSNTLYLNVSTFSVPCNYKHLCWRKKTRGLAIHI